MSIKELLVKILQWISEPILSVQNIAGDAYYVSKNTSMYPDTTGGELKDHGEVQIGVGVSRSGNRGIWDYKYSKTATAGKWLICHNAQTDHTHILCEGYTFPFKDHIIAESISGENLNSWSYRVYTNCTYECWGVFSFENKAVSNGWPSTNPKVYISAAIKLSDFPISFSRTPTINVSLQGTSGNVWFTHSFSEGSGYSNSNPGSIYLVSAAAYSSINCYVNIHAIGRVSESQRNQIVSAAG